MIWGFKELLWAALALMFAVLLAYVLIITVPRGVQGEATSPLLPRSVYDQRLDAIDREAVENAYRSQVEHLFIGWMKDATGQPGRAISGQRAARRAYVEIVTEIDKRKP